MRNALHQFLVPVMRRGLELGDRSNVSLQDTPFQNFKLELALVFSEFKILDTLCIEKPK